MKKLFRILITLSLISILIAVNAVPALAEYYNTPDEVQALIDNVPDNQLRSTRSDGPLCIDKPIVIDHPCTIEFESGSLVREFGYDGPLLEITSDDVSVYFLQDVHIFTKLADNDGAAILVKGDNCKISGGIFEGCQNGSDGVICVTYNASDCTIYRSVFNDCHSNDGGAIYLNGYNGRVIECEFNECSAEGDGGAIYVNDDAIIQDCIFSNCSAKGDGGSIYDNNAVGDVYIRGCSFKGGSCGGDGKWVDCNGDAWIDDCTYGTEKEYYDCDADKFHCSEPEPLGPYTRPNMGDYARETMAQNKYCDVIRPYISDEVTSELGYFTLNGTTDYGMGWMIDYEHPLTITAEEGYTITRIDAILTGGEENYENLIVDAGTKCKLYDNPYDFSNSIAKEQIAQIDDINSDSVTLTVNGNLYNYGTMHITDIVVYFEDGSDQALLGSALSGGTLAIVTAVAGLAIGLISGLIIGKKKAD